MSVFEPYKTKYTRDGARKIGFTANYVPLLEAGKITATIRVVFNSSPRLTVGQPLLLLARGMAPRRAVVTQYARAPFARLTRSDVRGCSADFATPPAARLALGTHFKRTIHDDTLVEVIRFRYVDDTAPRGYVVDGYADDWYSGYEEDFAPALSGEALFGTSGY